MGLGKTIEVIGLVLMNPIDEDDPLLSQINEEGFYISRATLGKKVSLKII